GRGPLPARETFLAPAARLRQSWGRSPSTGNEPCGGSGTEPPLGEFSGVGRGVPRQDFAAFAAQPPDATGGHGSWVGGAFRPLGPPPAERSKGASPQPWSCPSSGPNAVT